MLSLRFGRSLLKQFPVSLHVRQFSNKTIKPPNIQLNRQPIRQFNIKNNMQIVKRHFSLKFEDKLTEDAKFKLDFLRNLKLEDIDPKKVYNLTKEIGAFSGLVYGIYFYRNMLSEDRGKSQNFDLDPGHFAACMTCVGIGTVCGYYYLQVGLLYGFFRVVSYDYGNLYRTITQTKS